MRATLEMQARVTQNCVVTLEPFEARIEERSALQFVPARSLPEGEEEELDPESLEGPDEIPYINDVIDLGAALAEQLALALDPVSAQTRRRIAGGISRRAGEPVRGAGGKFGKPKS